MTTKSKKIEDVIHEIAFQKIESRKKPVPDPDPLLSKLVSEGSELWIDTGDLELARSIWKRESRRRGRSWKVMQLVWRS